MSFDAFIRKKTYCMIKSIIFHVSFFYCESLSMKAYSYMLYLHKKEIDIRIQILTIICIAKTTKLALIFLTNEDLETIINQSKLAVPYLIQNKAGT